MINFHSTDLQAFYLFYNLQSFIGPVKTQTHFKVILIFKNTGILYYDEFNLLAVIVGIVVFLIKTRKQKLGFDILSKLYEYGDPTGKYIDDNFTLWSLPQPSA